MPQSTHKFQLFDSTTGKARDVTITPGTNGFEIRVEGTPAPAELCVLLEIDDGHFVVSATSYDGDGYGAPLAKLSLVDEVLEKLSQEQGEANGEGQAVQNPGG